MVRCAGFTYGVAEVQTIYSAMENAEPFGFDPPVFSVPLTRTNLDHWVRLPLLAKRELPR